MTFDKGSLLLIDFTAKIKDSQEVFDTTIEANAKTHSIYEEDIKYTPRLVSIGEVSYPVLDGLDQALANMSVGEKIVVEVTPEKGFGERDPKKVRMIPIRKLGEDAEKVTVGDTVEIDNRQGIIRFIGSGRVQVDYNHRYAGTTIIYDVSVIKLLDSSHDKVDEILKSKFPVDDDKIAFELRDNEAVITIPDEMIHIDDLQFKKHIAQMDIFKFVPTLEKIRFVETHVNKQTQKPEKVPEQPAI